MTTVEVLNADARVLRAWFDEFDELICDPPFSPHVHAHAVSAHSSGAGTTKRDFGFDPIHDALRNTIAAATSRVGGWSLIYSDHEGAHAWRTACVGAGAEYIRTIPWVRWSQPQKSGDRPTQGSEVVLVFWSGRRGRRKSWTGPGSLTAFGESDDGQYAALDPDAAVLAAFDTQALRGADKHPTEKPLALLLSQVSWFTRPGEAVLDLCGGAGTTAQACRLLGRECLSVDLDQTWCERAQHRVTAPLGARDSQQAERWCRETLAQAHRVPDPTRPFMRKTYDRAQARIADALRVSRFDPAK